jgi:hypothetical protein
MTTCVDIVPYIVSYIEYDISSLITVVACRLSADSVECEERRTLISICSSLLGLLLIRATPSLRQCPQALCRTTAWLQVRSTSLTRTGRHTLSCVGFLPNWLSGLGPTFATIWVFLAFPAKQGALWTAAELNAIITGNLVGGPHGHLRTFGCIQWESDLFNGRPKARCYPFDIQGHRFRNRNPKVRYTFHIYRIPI